MGMGEIRVLKFTWTVQSCRRGRLIFVCCHVGLVLSMEVY